CVSLELLSLFKKAGLTNICFGIESTDPEVLHLASKKISIETVEKAIREAKTAGLNTRGFFILGLPGDSLQKWRKTLEWIKNSGLDTYALSLATPMPRTPMYDWIEENGKFLKDPMEHLYHCDCTPAFDEIVFETKDFTKTERIIAYREGMKLRHRMDRTTQYIIKTFFRKLKNGELTISHLKHGSRLVWDYITKGYFP
ncbi:MAG: radical SAM protein, partial [Thermodesulfobacteriota bacterium]|nr:radical SAM protein [Thermodesulfobacteriota bacterium]